jgi:hypothetical protein
MVMSMDDAFMKERALHIRKLAEKADPFIKRRLLDLALSYESRLKGPSSATVKLASQAPESTYPKTDE